MVSSAREKYLPTAHNICMKHVETRKYDFTETRQMNLNNVRTESNYTT